MACTGGSVVASGVVASGVVVGASVGAGVVAAVVGAAVVAWVGASVAGVLPPQAARDRIIARLKMMAKYFFMKKLLFSICRSRIITRLL